MKKNLTSTLLLFMLPVLSGCTFTTPKTDPDPTPVPPEPPVVDPDIFKDDTKLYNAFFDYTSKIEIELDFTNEAIYKLAQYGHGEGTDFAHQEMYHPCTMTVTINGDSKTYEGMGARMKGNTSRNESFVDESGHFDKGSSRWCHMKLSFSQTFQSDADNDYYRETFASNEDKQERKDRKFGGMKKFDIKWNKNYDNTYTRESYANFMLREEGLLSQKTNLVNLTVKSESDSFTDVFQVLETVDKQSLKKNFPSAEAKGNLYKCSYPVNFTKTESIGVESATWHPIYDLKTNDDTPDHTVLRNFLDVVNTKGDAETAKTSLAKVVDLEYFVKYSAMMWVIGNPDDLRNNTNNTYIYFNSKTNLMYPIPYDNDRCLGILQDWPIDMSTVWMSTTKRAGNNREWNENPLLWRLLFSESDAMAQYSDSYPVIESYRSKYINYCKEYANKYLDADKFQEFTNQFYYAKKDISKGGRENMSFEEYATNKLGVIELEQNY